MYIGDLKSDCCNSDVEMTIKQRGTVIGWKCKKCKKECMANINNK